MLLLRLSQEAPSRGDLSRREEEEGGSTGASCQGGTKLLHSGALQRLTAHGSRSTGGGQTTEKHGSKQQPEAVCVCVHAFSPPMGYNM